MEHVPAQAAAAGLRGVLDALTACTLVRQSVTYQLVETIAPTPAAGALASRVGVFIFTTSAADQYAVVEVPGLLDSFLQTTGPGAGLLINQIAPAVQALVVQLLAGVWCNPFGYQLVALEAAFLQIRP